MAKDLKVKVTTTDPNFTKLQNVGFTTTLFSNTLATLNAIASAYEMTWIAYAQGNLQVPGAPRIFSSGPYARSIQSIDNGPFEKEVFTDYIPHIYIESGHGEIDLKPGLLNGAQARMGKNGPYNIVSFRHYTRNDFIEQRADIANKGGSRTPMRRNVMPSNIQGMMRRETERADQAKQAGLSATGGLSKQLTAGQLPQQRTYEWGARLDSRLAIGKRSKLATGYTWASGKYAGMVRMNTPSGPREKRTQYRTFRVVSHKSDPRSWIVPPRPPIPIREATVDFVDHHMNVEKMLEENLAKDLQ